MNLPCMKRNFERIYHVFGSFSWLGQSVAEVVMVGPYAKSKSLMILHYFTTTLLHYYTTTLTTILHYYYDYTYTTTLWETSFINRTNELEVRLPACWLQ